jgi:hypothetical protein
MSNKLPSYFRRGLGVVNNDRQSSLAPFSGQPTPRLYDRVAEAVHTRHPRIFVMPTARGFVQVDLSKS